MGQYAERQLEPDLGAQQMLNKIKIEGIVNTVPESMRAWIRSQKVEKWEELPDLIRRYQDIMV